MDYFDSSKSILENVYLFSGLGTLVLVIIGLRQLIIAKKSIITSAEIRSVELAAQQIKFYCESIIPKMNSTMDIIYLQTYILKESIRFIKMLFLPLDTTSASLHILLIPQTVNSSIIALNMDIVNSATISLSWERTDSILSINSIDQFWV